MNLAAAPVRPALPGRAAETADVQRLLDTARAGRSAALVVRGEAGIGKSTLLRHAATAAPDMLVLTRTGVETETELPFAALHLLVKDNMAGVDELPEAQAGALRAALGLATAEHAPDRFLVGLAVLTLLAELAAQRPVLCLLDDAHWFDRASAEVLLFVARRLDAEAVVMLFAARTGHAPAFPAPGLAELALPRLDETTARHVLDSGGRRPPAPHPGTAAAGGGRQPARPARASGGAPRGAGTGVPARSARGRARWLGTDAQPGGARVRRPDRGASRESPHHVARGSGGQHMRHRCGARGRATPRLLRGRSGGSGARRGSSCSPRGASAFSIR